MKELLIRIVAVLLVPALILGLAMCGRYSYPPIQPSPGLRYTR
jgi:hypothetical protein